MSDVLGGVALATAPIPVIGDVAGAVSDAAMYAAYPEERTMLNAGMSLAGLLPFVPSAGGVMSVKRVAEEAMNTNPGLKLNIYGTPETGYTLSRIEVPKDQRNSGVGSSVMSAIVEAADQEGAKVALSPSADFGGNKKRLEDFYQRFGFTSNKGKSKDFSTMETMLRQPRPVQRAELDMSQAGSIVDASYRGMHQAPSISGANTLDNLADIYGDDIYSPNALRYFGMGDEFRRADMESLSAISRAKGKPNAMVTVYRAVPNFKTSAQKASELSEDMAQFLKRGRVPSRSAVSGLDGSKWYDWAYDERNRLSQIADNIPDAANQINPADWVSLSKDYAAKHGQSALEGNYKILSKKVKASELATTGDALSEWGWNPPTK
jgi:predicted GNAT family N-acyltransferase